jgi:hypothetical protein
LEALVAATFSFFRILEILLELAEQVAMVAALTKMGSRAEMEEMLFTLMEDLKLLFKLKTRESLVGAAVAEAGVITLKTLNRKADCLSLAVAVVVVLDIMSDPLGLLGKRDTILHRPDKQAH